MLQRPSESRAPLVSRIFPTLVAIAAAILIPAAGQAVSAEPRDEQAVLKQEAPLPIDYKSYRMVSRSVSADGPASLQLQAQYRGIPIYGSYTRLEANDKANGYEEMYASHVNLDLAGLTLTPAVEPNDAIESLKSVLQRDLGDAIGTSPEDGDVPSPEASLLIYPFDGRTYLAYEVQLRFTRPVLGDWVGYVDAATGEVIDRYDRLSAAAAQAAQTAPIGYGKGSAGTLQSFYVKSRVDAGKTVYQLLDATRPAAIRTFDFRKPSTRKDLPQGYDYVTSGSKTYADAAAVDAHVNAKRVYLFYKNKYGRNSIDDKNMDILSFVHVNGSAQTRNNAFWTGWAMYYGDGTGLKKGGVDCTSCAYDLVAHELTHGVTQHTLGLEYRGQAGALNEAISDIMAAVMDANDWEIGEDTGAAVRSLADPGKYGQPAHMDDFVNLPNDAQHDNGGVHVNSGIPAHAAYLTALKIDNADIGIGGRDTLGRLTYILLRDRLISPTADFYEAREGYIAAAGRLSGLTAEQKATVTLKVKDAWSAVGIDERSS
ncbi:M4 family metallopeptidase [Cohnella rhizosphaerae]|uniref:Neutral metalloproteinase n=1 Tax=Cohnella rhizosphaerae TaxID=1457232 RepID=A0A9X4KSK6_9BACL|nr:M4 family metallopeptidase [Cohnella rhizosphaerae]MDG0810092.1 M4 family metallopeptidase [Cohnella rhizosphaerae]